MSETKTQLFANPAGTAGFEFVEYTAPDPMLLRELFAQMGFPAIARHRRKDVTLHRQGDINFIINAEPDSFAQTFAKEHGPSACAMAFRVDDIDVAMKHLRANGAVEVTSDVGPMELHIPAIEGIGGSRIYLVDRHGPAGSIYDVDFRFEPDAAERMAAVDSNLTYIDHLTHNVHRGRMAYWADFYERLFNFREIRYFDIEGKVTGLTSKAMTSPCGRIRIPLNQSSDDKSQIEEFLRDYNGEGIQHIALGSSDIYATYDALAGRGVKFQDTPDSYFELLDGRVVGHGEPVEELRSRRILVDGAPTEGQGLLLQIFTQNVIGPIFFEIIQRKGNEGFGEGNPARRGYRLTDCVAMC
jgi:4-hydroxyphenylpyruvate dioxygenase